MIDENEVKELVAAGLSGKVGERGEPIPGHPRDVRIWVRDGFKCVYCGEYLLQDRIRMTSAQIDHLLPKSHHPDYEWNKDNRVLSCFCCNQLKRKFDPLDKNEELKEVLSPDTFDEKHRVRLVRTCQDYLERLRMGKEKILQQSKSVIEKYEALSSSYPET